MGKLQKKKNSVPFIKGAAPVAISLQTVDIQVCAHDKIECILDLVTMLSNCSTLSEQVKACQMMRGTVKQFSTTLNSEISADAEIAILLTKSLVYLYLYPTMFPIRRSLDWVVELAIRKCMIPVTDMAPALRAVTSSLLKKFDTEFCTEGVLDHYWSMDWVMSFSFFLVCERDSPCQWLSTGNLSADGAVLSEDVDGCGFLFEMLHRLGSVVSRLAAHLLGNNTQSAETSTAAALSLSSSASLLECYEESLRLSSSMIKAARHGLVVSAGACATKGPAQLSAVAKYYGCILQSCGIFAPSFLSAVLASGKLSFVTQDIVNSITLCVSSVQWAADMLGSLQKCGGTDSSPASLQHQRIARQMQYVCAHLRSAELCGEAGLGAQTQTQQADTVGLPTHKLLSVLSSTSSAPMVVEEPEGSQLFVGDAEFAYSSLRASLSVIDDDALLYLFGATTTAITTDTQSESESESVLVRLFAVIATNLGANPNNSLCFLGLQNLDTAFCRFQGLHQLCSDPVASLPMASRNNSEAVALCVVAGRKAWFDCVQSSSSVLTRNWISSNKQISHLVPMVYDRLVSITKTLLHGSDSSLTLKLKVWNGLVNQALSQPANHRGRYQSLTMLFDNIPVEITQQLLRAQQSHVKGQSKSQGQDQNQSRSMVSDLVEAVKLRDISSSSCSCLCTLLKKIKGADGGNADDSAETLAAFRDLWVPALVDALCDAASNDGAVDANITTAEAGQTASVSTGTAQGSTGEGAGMSQSSRNVAEYLIPEITSRVDNGCIVHIINAVRSRVGLTAEQRLWGLCQLLQTARQLGVDGGELINDETETAESLGSASVGTESVVIAATGLVRVSELKAAFVSSIVDICLVAFSALILNLKTIVPFSNVELSLIRFAFKYVVKCPLPDHRHKICRIVRALMTRVKESTRVSCRDINQLKAKLAKLGVEAETTKEKQVMSELQRVMDANIEFCEWFSAAIVSGLQPGCTYDMQMMLMDILNTVVDTLQYVSLQQQQVHLTRLQDMQAAARKKVGDAATAGNSVKEVDTGSGLALELGAAATQCLGADLLQQCFYTPDVVLATLQFCVSSWDRCRHTASDLLLKLPAPLPGIGTQTKTADAERSVKSVLVWAYSLANSVRQRESDAGAYILRDLFQIYVLKLGWRLSLPVRAPCECRLEAEPRNAVAEGVVLYGSNCTLFLNNLCDDLESRLSVLVRMYTHILNNGGVIKSSNVAEIEPSDAQGLTAVNDEAAPVSAASKEVEELDWQSGNVEYVSQGIIWTLVHCIAQILESDSLNAARLKNAYGADKCSALLGEWGRVVGRLHELMFKSFNTALMMVAEASTDTYFAPIIMDYTAGASAQGDATAGAASSTAKGPVHANSFMMVNTNGYLGATTGDGGGAHDEDDEEDGDFDGDQSGEEEDDQTAGGEAKTTKAKQSMIMQRAVVSAWLLAKSSVAAMVKLIELQPSVASLPAECVPPVPRFVSAHMGYIECYGNLLVDALSRLRHLGAILEVQVALQRICEIVLHPPAEGKPSSASSTNNSNSSLCHLPKGWLDLLLNRLQNEQQVFILRRSAGFAYSFLSILRAEGPSKTTTATVSLAAGAEGGAGSRSSLLQFTMISLLRIASKDVYKDQKDIDAEVKLQQQQQQQQTEGVVEEEEEGVSRGWRRCVHAINILRLILLDGTLTSGTDAYLASCCQLAITGFRSARWAIRNSCMMLFTAVVQKSVDNEKNESKNIIARRTLTVAAYFRRHPQLYPFIVSELQRAMGPSLSEQQEKYKQQSLYPILLLFAKLKPSFATADTPEGRSIVETLTDLTQLCMSAREGKTRIICARALASIVPVELIPAKIISLCESDVVNCASPNDLHGALLVIYYLCDSFYKHKLHFNFIYSVDNKVLLDRLDEQMVHSTIPCFVEILHTGLMRHHHNLLNMPPSVVMVYLKICHCLLSMGYDSPLIVNCNPSKLSATAFLKEVFYAKCQGVIGSLESSLSAVAAVPTVTTLCAVPFAPLLFQAALEYVVSDFMFVLSPSAHAHALAQPSVSNGKRILTLFCNERLGVDMTEVQMGVIVGLHAALDQPAEIMNWSFVFSLVHLIVCMLTKKSCTYSATANATATVTVSDAALEACKGQDFVAISSYKYGFTETVLECILALLNRLVRRHRFRSITRGLFVHYFDDLWRSLSELVSPQPSPPQDGEGVDISPTSLACNALELLGWMAQLCLERTEKSDNSSNSDSCGSMDLLAGWCQQLESASLETQPLQVRVFCARAILHSNILSIGADSTVTKQDGSYCDVLLTCWSIVLTLLQDDDSDVRLLARYAVGSTGGTWSTVADEWMDSGEEEFLCPHHRYRSSEPAMGASIMMTTVADVASATTEKISSNMVDLQNQQQGRGQHQCRFFVGQERVLHKISQPIAEALYASLLFHCQQQQQPSSSSAALGLWWSRWLRFAGRYETARRIMRASGLLSDTKAVDTDSRIFTAEQLNNNLELVSTMELWADVFARLCRLSLQQPTENDVRALLVGFVEHTIVPSVSQSLTLLNTFVNAATEGVHVGREVCLQHNVLAHDPDVYVYIYGNMYLLTQLKEWFGGSGGDNNNNGQVNARVSELLNNTVLVADSGAQVEGIGMYLHPNMRAMIAAHSNK